MPDTHAYIIGVLGLGILYVLLFFARRDLRRVMIYSSLLYLAYGFIIFLFIKLIATEPARTINPGYWTPPSLGDLNSRTGGYGFEDALFSLFVGGIAAGLYDLIFKVRISKRSDKKLKKGHALLFALIFSSAIFALTPINAIYLFILLQFLGACAIVCQRRDLLLHVLEGGVFFMVLYGLLFLIFRMLFPYFIGSYYHLQRTSHIYIFDVPLEEYLYALTLGMMWAPIYEYEFRLKDNKRRSLKLRRVSLAAGGARR